MTEEKKDIKKEEKDPMMEHTLGRGSEKRDHVNMVIYGRSGAGKTYEAATAPSPYVAAFDPRGHDAIPKAVPGQVIKDLGQFANILKWFESGAHVEHGIRTLIVDGLNFAYDMLVGEIGSDMVEQGRAISIDRLPYAGGLEVQNPYKRMLIRLVNLTTQQPEANRVHVIFTCLEEQVKESEKAPFMIRPLFGTKTVNQTFPALFSVIGYIVPVGEDENGDPTTERRMLFTEHNGILARDRTGLFPLMGTAPNLSEFLK